MAGDNLRGLALMLAAMALFAIEDMFLKLTAARLPTGEILVVSGGAGTVIFAALARREGKGFFSGGLWNRAVVGRNLGEMAGTFAYITALASAPLATVAAVLQALPLAATMGAALFMGAPVGWRRWSAILVGLAGVILVIQPGTDAFQPTALWVLVSVAGLTLRDLATRAVPPTTTSGLVSAWGLASVTVLGLAMLAIDRRVVMPTAGESAALVGVVLFGSAGYWAVVAAARTGEVAVVAPFRYARLVFAIVIGILVFGEWPNLLSLGGAALIVLSGLYSFARERARARSLSMTAPAG
ncbi:MAG: DMT family transporter [Proteobacteria bacterium]|nr:DMT family transporter [Pseudomonadota bacterium]MBS0572474.1 DMT family transporter [Pseudomonadota bacterium]